MSSITGTARTGRIVAVMALAIALAFCLQPVLAADETFTMTYRGPGGYYIGDNIIFDGINKVGNITLMKVTGPGLPAAGVPVYDLEGAEGTSNPVPVNADGTWRFVWYTSTIKGLDKMQTARYHITASDSGDSTATSTTSVMMKKPDFYVVASPSTLQKGEYLRLIGTAEKAISDIRIEISDANGNVVRTENTGASQTGYFTYALHVDMPPGEYFITVTSPSARTTFRTSITVIPPPTTAVNGTSTATEPGVPAGPVTTGTLSISSTPSGASVFVDSVSVGSTPLTQGSIAPGTHLVEIKYSGYQTYSAQAIVKAGETTTVAPALVKSPATLPVSPLTVLVGLVVAGLLCILLPHGRRPE